MMTETQLINGKIIQNGNQTTNQFLSFNCGFVLSFDARLNGGVMRTERNHKMEY